MTKIPYLFVAAALSTGTVTAQDNEAALAEIFDSSSKWEVAAEGFNFADGLCTDAEGNLYFSDVKGGTAIFKVDLTGRASEFVPDAAGISGLQFGSDGRLYACASRGRRVIVFDNRELTELAPEVRPNDLVVTHRGDLYFTMTPTKEIRRIDKSGKMTIANAGTVGKPNGITLSPDQKTLVVSDHGGVHAYAFPIMEDGALGKGKPFIDLKPGADNPEVARGDGAATDVDGRYYITTGEGLQIFRADGSLVGILPKPDPEMPLVSAGFAGPGHAYLYVANGGKIYRRKTKTSGALFFRAPK